MGLFRVCIFISLLCIGSCTLGKGGALSANVEITVLPYGKGSVLTPQVPRLAYSAESEELPCRPEQPNLQSIRDIPQLKVISELLLGDEEEEEGNQQAGRDEPVNISVQGGWIKLGFRVWNKNSGEGLAYVLRVDRLEFHGNGHCEQYGQPSCIFHQTISSGYCGLPFVYLATPGEAANYKPLGVEPLENLTIYVDQIPVIDASTLPKRDNQLPGGSTLILPQYQVDVLFTGDFLLPDGTALQPFRKWISFRTARSQSF